VTRDVITGMAIVAAGAAAVVGIMVCLRLHIPRSIVRPVLSFLPAVWSVGCGAGHRWRAPWPVRHAEAGPA
jgi:hypothetical protein